MRSPQTHSMSAQHTIYSMIFTTKNKELAIFGKTIDEIKKKWSEFVANVGEHGLFGENGAFASLFSSKKINNILTPEVLKQFDDFNEKFNSSSLSAEALAEQMENVDDRIVAYAKTCKNGEMTTEGFKKSVEGISLSAKAASAGMKALSIAGNLIAGIAVAKGIEWIATSISNYVNSSNIAKEKTEALSSSLSEAQSKYAEDSKKISELSSRYETLSEGVNHLGQNVSLSSSQYDEYKSVIQQLSDIMPDLTLRPDEIHC